MVTGPGRVLRAGLLLPLLAGVLAMHVLLVCSGSGEGHSDHGGTLSPVAMHSMAHAEAATVVEGVATVIRALPDTGPGLSGLAVCLAVVGAALVLGLRGRAAFFLARPVALATRSPGGAATARPPPQVPARVLLCVSRT